MNEDLVKEAERRAEIASAKLGVAENYRFYVGFSAALIAQQVEGSWLIAAAVFCVAFWFAAYSYDKEYETANDALERLTNTGKYYRPRSDP